MISAIAYCLLGAVVFVEQEAPGIRVGPIKPFTGQASVNYRQADLDGDGFLDLLLANEALFQREGRFPADLRVPFPRMDALAAVDTWGGEVYFKQAGRLAVMRWDGEAWVTTLDQELAWPDEDTGVRIGAPPEDGTGSLSSSTPRESDARSGGMGGQAAAGAAAQGTRPRLQRFLCDLDGDNMPEIIVPNAEGIHIFHKDGDRYAPSAPIAVLPPPRLTPAPLPPLWPSGARRISFPTRQMACRLLVDGPRVTVLTSEEALEGKMRYRRTTYALEKKRAWSLREGETEESSSGPLPPHLRPCRLNADDVIDYAGGRWRTSSVFALAIPLYETWATLDAGASFHVRRVPTFQRFRPRCLFVDFDGDGDMDMVTESTDVFDAGLREEFSRRLTQRTLDHKLQIYKQVQGRFSKDPELEKTFTIQLREPPFRQGQVFRRYLASALFDITGDFNGDGYRDVVIQGRPGLLEIYLAAGFGFPREPDATIRVPAEYDFGIADVNADGRSDIVLRPAATALGGPPGITPGGYATDRTRIFFAEEAIR